MSHFVCCGAGDVPYFPLVQQHRSLPEGLEGFPLSASAKMDFLNIFFLACGGFQGQTKCAGLGFDGWHHCSDAKAFNSTPDSLGM